MTAAKWVVGIDEVGRGPLAGPVVVCAALTMCQVSGIRYHEGKKKIPLRDSKKLTALQREKWFPYLTAHPKIRFAIARVSPRVIDRINISRAANLAALRAYARLCAQYKVECRKRKVYLDGGLYLKHSGWQKTHSPNARTVIRGDEKITAIKIASIIAKVTRDRLMARLSEKYPRYGLEQHKGYGTRRHREAIKKYGASELHRLTFLSKYAKMN